MSEEKQSEAQESEVSRRQFLKYLGAGTGALAFVFSPLSSLASIAQGDLLGFVKDNDLSLEDMDFRKDDPENPSEGDIWFRMDEAE